MKIQNGFYRFIISYLTGVGGFSVCLSLFKFALGEALANEMFIKAISSASISFIPVAAFAVFIIRTGVDSFELWVRRIINAFFSITCITLFFVAFGVLDSGLKVAVAFSIGIIGNLSIIIPLFIVLDRREKRKLTEINKKLNENRENSETF